MWEKIKQGFKEWYQETREENHRYWRHREKMKKARRRERSKRRAIKEADAKHAADNRTYYVMIDWEGIYHAFNRDDIKYLKRIGILKKNTTIEDILRESVYITRRGNNDGR